MSKKNLYVVYGTDPALLRATNDVLPANSRALHQHPYYFERSGIVDGAFKVLFVYDTESETQTARAEEIAQAYVDKYGEGILLELDLAALADLSEASTSPDVVPAAADLVVKGGDRDMAEVSGIGKATKAKLAALGVVTLQDLAALNDNVEELVESTGIGNLAELVAKADALVAGNE